MQALKHNFIKVVLFRDLFFSTSRMLYLTRSLKIYIAHKLGWSVMHEITRAYLSNCKPSRAQVVKLISIPRLQS